MPINNFKTFPHGGVHPLDHKLSADQPIKKAGIPQTVFIPISQHIGAPAKPLVKPLTAVKVGQVIAESGGFVSANIHSSVSGKVKKIDDFMDTGGYKKKMIMIEVEGDEWVDGIDLSSELKKDITLDQKGIVKCVIEAGIVGMGGATFPSHVKLSIPDGKTAEILLINGVECEPFLTSDHRLMLERTEEVLVGIQILKKSLGVDKAIIGIESNKLDAIEKLLSLTQDYPGIDVQPLKVQYPQGAEKQLIEALTSKQVPSGKLPIDIGCVVHNVATALAVYEAVQKNKPLMERVVTLTGTSLKQPSNFLARIGTPISFLVEAAGGYPEDTGKIISGGPMMGKAITSMEIPVTKGTSGIVFVPLKESSRQEMSNCIRCGKCVSKCPLNLQPYLMMSLTQKNLLERAEEEFIMDCCECGSCQFACPAHRPLLDYIRIGKAQINKIKSAQVKK